ncbi:hypothetical protein CPT_Mana_060 [Burkholderia phage Mana]|uniref:Uncharacterized protein n=1 Tax=Burkholderia phage Mana TaxID=2767578 RepID=A0A873WN11_9CAUD|nr:hypothetical protein KNV21_gp60 [Burkholderia phage Mana]QPB09455.1 hypothetical protein CPT_Mana_060 [Burkholderia phage Mana]
MRRSSIDHGRTSRKPSISTSRCGPYFGTS